MNLDNKPHVTYPMLQAFLAAPGQIDIHVLRVQRHYVPFVFFAPPGQEQTGYGPIVHDESLVAGDDADELIEELREKLGPRPNIFRSTPRAAMPHPTMN